MKNIVTLINNELHFSLNEQLYDEDVVFKCFYWYGTDYNVEIDKKDNVFFVKISSKSETKIDHDHLLIKIKQDLIDFKLRDIVTKETKNIRELLTAKAFAHFETDENPVTEISDPIGFDPTNF
ncbi:His-Xaa-Ser system protein HxsD [Flavobacterium sharifuzzamanii]|uniref:His-Xaa-Ser system protein HxsD n=1 Tax=Flavobacterium sharifuzzamanii TaxID=2211133 RepID=UPI000DAC5690|nr:His-Xaa-Ser system protein HxsD [Flavobacterium sharifuzzamanii]KAF2082091.1 His-Xaa-Ser system protein HxsD [Flavobacterium sharifuzzamanii]